MRAPQVIAVVACAILAQLPWVARGQDVPAVPGTPTGIPLNLTAPSEGSTIGVGDTVTITWVMSSSVTGTVEIDLLDSGGSVLSSIADAETDDGTYTWDTSALSTGSRRVRVSATTSSTVRDEADITVVIRSVDVTTPNGGESVDLGETFNITWTSANLNGSAVEIDLLDSGGSVLSSIADAETDDGTFSWFPLGTLAEGSYKIRVSATTLSSVTYPEVTDDSDATFTFQYTVPSLPATPDPAYIRVTLSGTDGTGNDTGWRLFTPPVTGATRADLTDDMSMSVSTGSVLYSHDGSDYVAVTSDATSLPNGRGFLLYIFDDATETVGSAGIELDFMGNRPNADVTVSSLAVDKQWHLLGNPFDNAFDLSSLNLVAQGFQATVQIWDPSTSSWSTVTQDAGTTDKIAAWQGLFVERTTLNSGETSLTFDHDGLSTGGDLIGGKLEGDGPVRLSLVLEAFSDAREPRSRDEAASIYFVEGADEGWDAFDATKQTPPLQHDGYALLALVGERAGRHVDLAQRSHPARWHGEAEFPLAIMREGSFTRYRLSWPWLSEIPAAWSLQLEDRLLGRRIDLRQAPWYELTEPVTEDRLAVIVERASAVSREASELPGGLMLAQNHPNPFNPRTTIRFALPAAGEVTLGVYDVLGSRVAILVEGLQAAGWHQVGFDAGGLSSGLYLYRLTTPGGNLTQTMQLVR